MASLWFDTAERERRPALDRDVTVDVAVVGAGISGLTTAYELTARGADVAVLEARRVAAGATGYNTAKLSSLHGLAYSRLSSSLGEEAASVYADANEAGIERVFAIVAELGIDCDLRRKPNLTYTESDGERARIEGEVAAARRAGLDASLVEETDLPYPIAAGVRVESQAEFHPVAYVEGMARELRVYEGTAVTAVDAGLPCRVRTAAGRTVTADHVVVATHLPFLDRGLYFARCHPERSYVVAAPVERPPAAMYLSTESPAHSIRAHAREERSWLLVGGGGHKAGQADARERYERLAAWARERFGIEPTHRWATQDQMPVDGVPYIGACDPLSRNVWVATGFKKWGLAMGTSAGTLLVDLIDGRDNPWRALFDPARLNARAGATSFVKENANVALRFVGDRVVKRAAVDDVGPGEGRVVGSGLGQRAVYRDDDGELHSLSARCTHLGCIVGWNSGERTWDCPCHGSRFDTLGNVIEGPAVRPLGRRE